LDGVVSVAPVPTVEEAADGHDEESHDEDQPGHGQPDEDEGAAQAHHPTITFSLLTIYQLQKHIFKRDWLKEM
jgi:hypothetical protein